MRSPSRDFSHTLFAGSIERTTHLKAVRHEGDAHALRSQRSRSHRWRGRHRHHGPRHHAGLGPGRHARPRLRREAGRRAGGQGLHRQDARRRWCEKGRLPEADAKAAVDRIVVAEDLEEVGQGQPDHRGDHRAARRQAGAVRQARRAGRPDTILASNTSSIPITAIASACKHPERVGGMHFFNPVPLMRLVEMIPGLKTAPWVTDAMMALGRRMTREPVLCTDSPAFLVNHVGPRLRAGVAAHPDREHRHRRRHRPHPHRRAGLQAWGRSRSPTWSASTSSTA